MLSNLNLVNTHKATRVVVANGFSISKGLQKRVGLQNDIFYSLDRKRKQWYYISSCT
jgi:hypothetical protein